MSGPGCRTLLAGLAYPEKPTLDGHDLLLVEYHAHAVRRLRAGSLTTVWEEPGAGPAAALRGGSGELWVCAYDRNELVRLDARGAVQARIGVDAHGEPLEGPNDLCLAPDGTLFFTASGRFAREAPATGKVLRLRPGEARPAVVARDLRYPNGIALRGAELFVAEHLADRILRGALMPSLTLSPLVVEAELSQVAPSAGPGHPLKGPDGIAFDRDGVLHVAHWGTGRLLSLGPGGALRSRALPMQFVTNVACGPGRLVVTAFDRDAPPYPGALFELR